MRKSVLETDRQTDGRTDGQTQAQVQVLSCASHLKKQFRVLLEENKIRPLDPPLWKLQKGVDLTFFTKNVMFF